jgi:MFS family permease
MSAAPPTGELPLAKNRSFRLLWLGQTASNLGDAFAFVATPLFVLEATHSVVKMGYVSALACAGQLSAGVFSGFIVDHANRRHLMLACDVVRALLFALLSLSIALGHASVTLLYGVTLLSSMASNVFLVSYIAAVSNLVAPAQVAAANGRLQASQALTFVIGSALAGVVSNRFGSGAAFGVNAASFVASAVTVSRIALRRDRAEHEKPSSSVFAGLRAGLAFLFAHPVLRSLAIFQTGVALLGSVGVGASVIDLFVYRTKVDFRGSSVLVGICLAMAAVGGLLGALSAARSQRYLGLGTIALIGTALQAAGLLAAGLGTRIVTLILGGVLWSGGLTYRAVGITSLRQLVTPDELLGRVISSGWVSTFSAAALGALLITRLAATLGAPLAMTSIGALLAGVAGLGALSPIRRASGSR